MWESNDIELQTKQSPRYENKVWKWYEGNTFSLIFKIRLLDNEGEEIELHTTDKIVCKFYNVRTHQVIQTFEFKNLEYEDDGLGHQIVVISTDFTDEITAKFPYGKYVFDITFYGDSITTIYSNAEVEVERCH